jgi:phospholipid N-methyltransferase
MANMMNHNQVKIPWNNAFTFLRGFLQHPDQVGSIVPSSRFLEQRLVDVASIARAKTVVELGPGTGGTTQAILDALLDDAKFLAIELNPEFASLLQSNPDPRLIVHHGSAEQIGQALALYDIPRPEVVVSGIPFSTMPDKLAHRILQNVWTCLVPGGNFTAYQFRGRVADLGRELLGKPEVTVELFNVPPVRVYCWKKPLTLA